MVEITNTTQLDFFSILKSVLKTNTVINDIFGSKIRQFEPDPKESKFKNYPYIWAKIPTTPETELITLDHGTTNKLFNVEMFVRTSYINELHKQKFRRWLNSIISVVEGSETTFDNSGYYNIRINLVDIDDQQIISQKQLLEAKFELTFSGFVARA